MTHTPLAPLFPFSHTRASPRSYACYTALLPDLVPSAHLGRASGTMATMSMLGALLGFGLFGFWLSILHAYTIYCVVIILTVSLTCVTAREKKRDESPAFSYSELVAAYSIDVVAHSDFFWVFVTRVFYYMGISLQVCYARGSPPLCPLLARLPASLSTFSGVCVLFFAAAAACRPSCCL